MVLYRCKVFAGNSAFRCCLWERKHGRLVRVHHVRLCRDTNILKEVSDRVIVTAPHSTNIVLVMPSVQTRRYPGQLRNCTTRLYARNCGGLVDSDTLCLNTVHLDCDFT